MTESDCKEVRTNSMVGHMDHTEAVNQMAVEKYLLGELPPDVRDAFEEHFFDCAECAVDMRVGMEFVEQAKAQLPSLATATQPQTHGDRPAQKTFKVKEQSGLRAWWAGWFANPMFGAPVFATLLLVIGYQNLVTYPTLRSEATDPQVLPAIALHGTTRGGDTVVTVARHEGISLLMDLPEAQGYSSFAVDLYDAQGKLAWTHNLSASGVGADGGTLSLVIPGGKLQQGKYALALSGVTAQGQRSELERHSFNVQIHE
jgi:hypothetical protein